MLLALAPCLKFAVNLGHRPYQLEAFPLVDYPRER
jgi:hypothetical protein